MPNPARLITSEARCSTQVWGDVALDASVWREIRQVFRISAGTQRHEDAHWMAPKRGKRCVHDRQIGLRDGADVHEHPGISGLIEVGGHRGLRFPEKWSYKVVMRGNPQKRRLEFDHGRVQNQIRPGESRLPEPAYGRKGDRTIVGFQRSSRSRPLVERRANYRPPHPARAARGCGSAGEENRDDNNVERLGGEDLRQPRHQIRRPIREPIGDALTQLARSQTFSGRSRLAIRDADVVALIGGKCPESKVARNSL